jgi:DNA-binding response OmpR family regulator
MWKTNKHTNDKYRPRVLICDQQSRIGGTLHGYLSSIGFHIEQAFDEFECIDIACDRHPDVILLDLDMPHIDGESLVRELRFLGINVPIVLFSSGESATTFDPDAAFVKKPLRHKELALILETMLLETKKDKRFLPRRFRIH